MICVLSQNYQHYLTKKKTKTKTKTRTNKQSNKQTQKTNISILKQIVREIQKLVKIKVGKAICDLLIKNDVIHAKNLFFTLIFLSLFTNLCCDYLN